MSQNISLPIFDEIDRIRLQVKELDKYDPLTSIIKDQFELEVTLHLSSLSAEIENEGIEPKQTSNLDVEHEKYTQLGLQHAVTELFFDLAQDGPTASMVVVLYEMLFHTKYKSNDSEGLSYTIKTIGELLLWYEEENEKGAMHPLVLAAMFHHKFSSEKHFDDGNGRVGRLLLNVQLMRNDYLPILIQTEERKLYYKALSSADNGNMSLLSMFIAQKEQEALIHFTQSAGYLSVQGKFELEMQLKKLNGSEKCIVLTEDSQTDNLLGLILESSGFKMEETNIVSYEGCSKLASANLFSVFIKEKMPYIRIVVHRDRDYLTDFEISEISAQFKRIDVNFFVTRGTDIESHFLNHKHLNFCHPNISTDEAKHLIEQSMTIMKQKSIDLLRKKELGGSRDPRTSHLNKGIEDIVNANPYRFTYGKGALNALQKLIQKRIAKKSRLLTPSKFLSDPTLSAVAKKIW